MLSKRDIRVKVKMAKSRLTAENKLQESLNVFMQLENADVFQQSQNILLYYSLLDELPTHDVVARWSKTKNVFLPRVNGDMIDILPFDGQLSTDNQYGICEPVGNKLMSPTIIDLVIVPAVAVDAQCNRLGRGRGFYDRLLPLCVNAKCVAVAFDCQFFTQIPIDTHDFPMDEIFTPSHHYKRKK